ncbi:uncharacterized protein I206_104370 [Kwoniella pini CBS 10737]|uniref:Uncharacterized protein n=1 Tax=Kwoniella pini CBS 10737 TaxID=1296096 RepID=A0A1B9I1V4_9TREE|nr:uncharacterized protein I206_04051 [Kwoniella pini CBS 10737]OCF49530.1 hypothetical protein I206_04051 [Kwoniella pini CBS 10737]
MPQNGPSADDNANLVNGLLDANAEQTEPDVWETTVSTDASGKILEITNKIQTEQLQYVPALDDPLEPYFCLFWYRRASTLSGGEYPPSEWPGIEDRYYAYLIEWNQALILAKLTNRKSPLATTRNPSKRVMYFIAINGADKSRVAVPMESYSKDDIFLKAFQDSMTNAATLDLAGTGLQDILERESTTHESTRPDIKIQSKKPKGYDMNLQWYRFKLKRLPFISDPIADEYIKLPKTIRQAVTYQHNNLFSLRPKVKELYVSKKTMKELKDNTVKYKWVQKEYTVPYRTGSGKPGVFILDQKAMYQNSYLELHDTAPWEIAWKEACSDIDPPAYARYRDVSGITLLIEVLAQGGAVVTKDIIEGICRDLKSGTNTKPVDTNFIVVSVRSDEQKKKYSFLASLSPYQDYSVYMEPSDVIKFLTAYPPRKLPSIAEHQTFVGALDGIDKNPTQSKKLAAEYVKMEQAQRSVSRTNMKNVSVASVGRATGAPRTITQASVMGGSATEVATGLSWPSPSSRVPMINENGVNWRSPRCYPSEWLHRHAWGWGDEKNLNDNQVYNNLIFGSSECNTIMIRYEKAWQRLFTSEAIIYEATTLPADRSVKKLRHARAVLVTVNTDPRPENANITDIKIENGTLVRYDYMIEHNQVKKQRTEYRPNDVPLDHTESSPIDATNENDYWTRLPFRNPACYDLCYRLRWLSDPQKPSILASLPIKDLQTRFSPFSRAVFTRLEWLLDDAITEKYIGHAIERIGPPLPLNITPTPQNDPNGNVQPIAMAMVSRLQGLALSSSSNNETTWQKVVKGEEVKLGGVILHNVGLTHMTQRHQIDVPISTVNAIRSNDIPGIDGSSPSPSHISAMIHPSKAGLAHIASTSMVKRVALARMPAIAMFNDGNTGDNDTTSPPMPAHGPTIPDGYVLHGDINLFGICTEKLYDFDDPINGSRQLVVIQPDSENRLSSFVPALAGIHLNQLSFAYNPYDRGFVKAGTWLHAQLTFDGPLSGISTTLKDVFGQTIPCIDIECQLSPFCDWTTPLSPRSITMRGIIPRTNIPLGDCLNIIELGVGVSIYQKMQPRPPHEWEMATEYSFFGRAQLLGYDDQEAPLVLDFIMSVSDDGLASISLSAGNPGPHCFGVSGLKLSELNLYASFVANSPGNLMFVAEATLSTSVTSIHLEGYYSRGDWSIFSQIEHFTVNDLIGLYDELFEYSLLDFNHDVEIQKVILFVGPDGFSFECDVVIEGHTALSALLIMDTRGVTFSGKVEGDIPLIDDVVLKEASLDIHVLTDRAIPEEEGLGSPNDTTEDVIMPPVVPTAKAASGYTFQFAFKGIIQVENQIFTAGLYIDKTEDGKLYKSVFGEAVGVFLPSNLNDAFKDTFVDQIAFTDICIMWTDAPADYIPSAPFPPAFPIVPGIQIAGHVVELASFDSAMNNRTATTGLTLSAVYRKGSGFELTVQLLVTQGISPKSKRVQSDTIVGLTFAIRKSLPYLIIGTTYSVKPPRSDTVLTGHGELLITPTKAVAEIQLTGDWKNPFNISDKLTLKLIALEMGIVYASPIWPSELALAFRLALDGAEGHAAVLLGEDPSTELISVEVDSLSMKQLVELADGFVTISWDPPSDLLKVNKVKYYISTGTFIGTQYYPPGVCFEASATMFNVNASIACTVDQSKQLISASGTLDPMTIGPLTVTGTGIAGSPAGKASFAVSLSTGASTVSINGAAVLGRHLITAMTTLDIALAIPAREVSMILHAAFDWSDTLKVKLRATMSGQFTSFRELSHLQFQIDFEMESNVLEAIHKAITDSIQAARQELDHEIAEAQEAIAAAEEQFDSDIIKAEGLVTEKQAALEVKKAIYREEEEKLRIHFLAEAERLEHAFKIAYAIYTGALSAGENHLRRTTENAELRKREAVKALETARRDARERIDIAERELQAALEDMNKRFGDAEAWLRHCQEKVEEAETHYRNMSWFKSLPALAALEAAKFLLILAEKVVEGPGYAAAKSVMSEAQVILATAQSSSDTLISEAEADIILAETEAKNMIDIASDALKKIRETGDEVTNSAAAQALWKAAVDAAADQAKKVDRLLHEIETSIEEVELKIAQVALDALQASADTALIAASKAVGTAGIFGDTILDASQWIVDHAFILKIEKIKVTGDLSALTLRGGSLSCAINGTFANDPFAFTLDFAPGKTDDFVHTIYLTLMDKTKRGEIKVPSIMNTNKNIILAADDAIYKSRQARNFAGSFKEAVKVYSEAEIAQALAKKRFNNREITTGNEADLAASKIGLADADIGITLNYVRDRLVIRGQPIFHFDEPAATATTAVLDWSGVTPVYKEGSTIDQSDYENFGWEIGFLCNVEHPENPRVTFTFSTDHRMTFDQIPLNKEQISVRVKPMIRRENPVADEIWALTYHEVSAQRPKPQSIEDMSPRLVFVAWYGEPEYHFTVCLEKTTKLYIQWVLLTNGDSAQSQVVSESSYDMFAGERSAMISISEKDIHPTPDNSHVVALKYRLEEALDSPSKLVNITNNWIPVPPSSIQGMSPRFICTSHDYLPAFQLFLSPKNAVRVMIHVSTDLSAQRYPEESFDVGAGQDCLVFSKKVTDVPGLSVYQPRTPIYVDVRLVAPDREPLAQRIFIAT